MDPVKKNYGHADSCAYPAGGVCSCGFTDVYELDSNLTDIEEPGPLHWARLYDLEQGSRTIEDGVQRLIDAGFLVGDPMLDGEYAPFPEGEAFFLNGELSTYRQRSDGWKVRRVVVVASKSHKVCVVGIEQKWRGVGGRIERAERVTRQWVDEAGKPKGRPVVTETLRPDLKPAQRREVDCPRCGGVGKISIFRHVENGVCFECRGTKISTR